MVRMVGKNIQIKGIVQGVGFRPFIYKKALGYSLKGRVMNSSSGVLIDVEGPAGQLESFLNEITSNPPPLARITQVVVEDRIAMGYEKFEIIISQEEEGRREALVPPDVALCEDCKRDIFDSRSRYYLYPFTNCTNCGPRFTIVKDIPYDRSQTTMKEFLMCSQCRKEYEDPLDRRFHAQPVACPKCGPRVKLVNSLGGEVEPAAGDIFPTFRKLIKEGNIIALKGLGGFHLACNGVDYQAIKKLRDRKKRPAKPFAVMVRDVQVVKKICRLNEHEEQTLTGPIAPIVILEKTGNVPGNLAPGMTTLGVMVPYTPLHFLLFDEQIELLVMTSGNISNLPLVKDNEEAFRDLQKAADYFLIHDRDIFSRCDDSLVRVIDGEINYWRRSRGAVPHAIEVPAQVSGKSAAVLGSGSEMKNTFCLLKGNLAYLSQHIGELDCLEGMENYRESLNNFADLIDLKPSLLGFDYHPGYHITRLAQELPLAVKIPVQHHHAHMAACMAEHKLDEEVIGVILDGTGYGLDGKMWGFEFISGNYEEFFRHGHLQYVPLPGGERAIKNPWLMATAYLASYFSGGLEIAKEFFPGRDTEIDLVGKLIAQGLNSPLSSGCGRLFDAVSALLGVCEVNTYEGQAAIELGERVVSGIKDAYPFDIKASISNHNGSNFVLIPGLMLQQLMGDVKKGGHKQEMATKFHNTVIKMVLVGVQEVAAKTGLSKVMLSGGTWQNIYLLQEATNVLKEKGFQVFSHRLVPASDGGLALGQTMIAYRRWIKDVSGSSG
jgi:hydrogenase maturation protein HypF